MTQVKNSFVALLLLLVFVVVIWGVFLVNWWLLDGELNRQGIRPIALPYEFVSVLREIGNISFSPSYIWRVIQSILMSPLLHAGFGHIWSNTLALLILGGLVALRGVKSLIGVSIFVVLLGGTLVWLFGRPAVHIGASGLVFGYFGYLVALGWFRRSIVTVGVAALVLFVYGVSIFLGALPQGGFISWEGHLFGLIAGVLAAMLSRRTPE
ncbi:MAG: rhomboid family intramembrane serine protease [Chloroflexi bacterium]|nr:rhomboid family intramembrane serine protease [Chloroflexota bacterium]